MSSINVSYSIISTSIPGDGVTGRSNVKVYLHDQIQNCKNSMGGKVIMIAEI